MFHFDVLEYFVLKPHLIVMELFTGHLFYWAYTKICTVRIFLKEMQIFADTDDCWTLQLCSCCGRASEHHKLDPVLIGPGRDLNPTGASCWDWTHILFVALSSPLKQKSNVLKLSNMSHLQQMFKGYARFVFVWAELCVFTPCHHLCSHGGASCENRRHCFMQPVAVLWKRKSTFQARNVVYNHFFYTGYALLHKKRKRKTHINVFILHKA